MISLNFASLSITNIAFIGGNLTLQEYKFFGMPNVAFLPPYFCFLNSSAFAV